ncbi:uncharacterized protein LOC122257625 isoform X1 [Penaeus japonicus]|uniref:uncharacterized protein LOC122257625 isoform X1 n=1 Tax=Penaeus japonicus TaxID=27405 RepID=UPI001C70E3CA|nr:uncharacterized protein LOC122257625 isoform X1 [Penaeus japonicus]XP_042878963.1 uncharacterized protein LOC122257625 isoform X1 [Penaeus japonicus]
MAAMVSAFLLLVLSQALPLATADSKILPLDLPFTRYMKLSKTSRVNFTFLFESMEEKEESLSIDEKWHEIKVFRNEDQNVVLDVPPYGEKKIDCCKGERLKNCYVSSDVDFELSEKCPLDQQGNALFNCIVTESTTSDPPTTQDPATTTNPSSNASDSGNSTAQPECTEPSSTREKILWKAVLTGLGVLMILVVSVVCYRFTKNKEAMGSLPPLSVREPLERDSRYGEEHEEGSA